MMKRTKFMNLFSQKFYILGILYVCRHFGYS